MLEGLMQNDYPLTVRHVLERVRRFGADSEVATLKGEGDVRRARYPDVARRADRLASALSKRGIQEGDRVGTFMWNNQEHFEAYLAVPSMGVVLNTVNIRLFPEQVVYIVNHAKNRVLFVDDSLVEVLEKVAPQFETVEHIVVVGDGDAGSLQNVIRYEDLLAEGDDSFDYPELDERAAAALCYTSGTTGNPKGVLYSHRSTILHAFGHNSPDALGLRFSDRVLPIVPMFHVNAWGIPYGAGMTGASLVMPDRFLQGEPIARLIESEKVTCSAGVPTVWSAVLDYMDDNDVDTSSLRVVVCGGAAVPQKLMQGLEERHGITMVQGWGMTETSPVCAVARPPADVEPGSDEMWSYRTAAGRLLPFVEARLIDDNGDEVEWDGKTTGELEVRGPWIARDYYEDPSSPEKFHDGWLCTGDICSIDELGYVRISDRSKDVIKSGGEWISSVELEQALMAHDAVTEAAVIARPDEKWSERPLACVVSKGEVSPAELRKHLESRVAKWWIPETYAFIDEVPKTSVGKFDKKVLRQRLKDGELEQVGTEPEAAKA